MSQYILVLVWIGMFAIITKYIKGNGTELVDGFEVKHYHWFFAFLAFAPIILVAGYRPEFLMDTGMYTYSFARASDSLLEISSFVSARAKDAGFSVFIVLIKTLITNDKRLYLIVVAFLQGVLLLSFFKKYSPRYMFSVFLFVASTDYIAVLIILLATPLLLKKKYAWLTLVILLASTFHQSALLMIPVVFLVQGEAWNKKTLLFIVSVLLVIFFIGNFTSLLNDALVDTQYKNVVNDYTRSGDDGTNPIRVLVYSVPTILAFFYRKQIKATNSKLLNICVNMSIVSTGLYIISMFTSGIYLGRLPIYASLYNYILLPYEIDIIFNGKNREYKPLMYIVTCVLYLAFYFYQMHFINGLI